MECSCKSTDLLNFGCSCGAFEFEIHNHIWCNGIVYAIARNEDEAVSLCKEYLSEFEDFDPLWLTGDGWALIPDDNELPLIVDDLGDEEEIRLASEWIDNFGPGFLAVV